MQFEGYTITTDATTEPVTAAEMREWLRLDDTSQDTMLAGMITAARVAIEQHTHRSIVQKTIKQSLVGFPASGCIELLFPELGSVTSVQYYDSDNSSQTVDSSNYIVDTNRVVGAVQPLETYTWPSTYERTDAVNITYVTKDDTPKPAEILIKMIAADMYEHAETQSEINLTENRQWKFLLDSLTIKDFY
jgi:uncharacterized phiE125 gp8 family phage protein